MDNATLAKNTEKYKKVETLTHSSDAGINRLNKAAEQAAKLDQNLKHTQKLAGLKSTLSPEQQIDGLSFLQSEIINILAKLKKKDKKIDLAKIRPGHLAQFALQKNISLRQSETTAMEKLNELLSQPGATATYLAHSWKDIISQAENGSKGWGAKLKESFKENPMRTTALLVAGASGLYLGWNLIKKLWSSKEKKAGDKKESFWSKLLPSGKSLGPLGIMVAGLFLGKNELKKLLGLNKLDDIQKALKEGKSIPEKYRKKLEARIRELEDRGKHEKEKVKKMVKSPQNQFMAAKMLFKKLHFYDIREFKDLYLKDIDSVLVNLKIKKIKITILQTLFKKYQNKESIPKNEFPVNTKGIKPEHLFLILKGIVDISQYFYGNLPPTEETIETLFIKTITDPIHEMNDAFHNSILSKTKNGNFFGVLEGAKYDEIDKKLKGKRHEFIETISRYVQPSEILSVEEKKALRKIQIELFLNANLRDGGGNAVTEAINSLSSDSESSPVNEKVKRVAEKFFQDIKNKTEKLLPECHKRFEIKGMDTNHIKDGLEVDKITFGHAIQLVLVASSINWSESEKSKIHWMKDFALLNVILRILEPEPRNRYINQLAKAAIESETNLNISIPAIHSLMPYAKKVAKFGRSKLINKGLGILEMADEWKKGMPSKTKDFKKMIKEHPYIAFGEEALGGIIEMSTDTLALMIAALGITPQDLGVVKSAKNLFDLIASKGGHIAFQRSKDGGIESPGMLAINIGWEYIFAKPGRMLAKTMGSLSDGDWGDAVTTWTIGGAPFVTIGALSGLTKPGILPKVLGVATGVGKGLAYPIYAPYYGVKYGAKTIKGTAVTIARASEYTKRPFRLGGDLWRWSEAKIKYGLESQSIGNLLKNGKDLQYFEHYSELAGLTKRDKFWELTKSPQKAAQRLAETFNEQMARRYASRFADNYNDFFGFSEAGVKGNITIAKNKLTLDTISEHKLKAEQLEKFIRRFNSNSNNFEEIKKLMKKTINRDALEEGLEKIFMNAGLSSDNERRALAKNLKTDEDFSRFMKQMKDGERYLDGTKTLKGIGGVMEMKDLNIKGVDDILEKNKQIESMVLNKDNAFGRLMRENPAQGAKMIKLMDQDPDFLKLLTHFDDMANEPEIIKRFQTFSMTPSSTGKFKLLIADKVEVMQKRNKILRKIELDNPVKMRELDGLKTKTYETIGGLQEEAKGLQKQIQEGLQKNPDMSLKEFFSGAGADLKTKLDDINTKIVDKTKGFTSGIAQILSDKKIQNLEDLSPKMQKIAHAFIIKSAGAEIPVSRRIVGKLFQNIGGRLVIFAPILGIRAYLHGNQEGLKDELISGGVALAPVAGTIADFYSAVTGKDYFTNKEVDRLTSFGWGIVGIGCDIGMLFGGAGAGARIILKSARAGGKYAKVSAKIAKSAEKTSEAIEVIKAGKNVQRATKLGYAGALGMTAFTVGKMTYEYVTLPKETASIDL